MARAVDLAVGREDHDQRRRRSRGSSGPRPGPATGGSRSARSSSTEMPQRKDARVNSSTETTKVFTTPKRAINQPVSGTRDAVGHGERGDHPGALAGADAQIAGDGRDRDVGDGAVQHLHEGAQRQGDGGRAQRDARRGAGPIGGRSRGGTRGGEGSWSAEWRFLGRLCRRAYLEVSIVAFIDRPTRSGWSPQLGRVQLDADGQALHHLDPVARGVLGQDQREGRTGAARQTLHPAVELHAVAVEVEVRVTGWPMRTLSSCTSLKLAST